MTEHDRDGDAATDGPGEGQSSRFPDGREPGRCRDAACCVRQRLGVIQAVICRGIGSTGRVRWPRRVGKRRGESAEAALHTDVESDFNLYNWVDYDAPETTAGSRTNTARP